MIKPIQRNIEVFIFFILVGILLSTSCTPNKTQTQKISPSEPQPKHRGAHVFGITEESNLESLKPYNFNYLTLVAWGSQADYDSPIVGHHNGDSLMIRYNDSIWIERIKSVKSQGYKVFVKPHIWLNQQTEGKWRSDIFPTNETNWDLWKESYRHFILRYARIAEAGNAEMYCVGTELTRLSLEKPSYWKKLIQEVRQVYSGKLIYAANWYEEYDNISFWEDLDYIGIQAYFPLSKKENPTIQEIAKGWEKHISAIENIQKKYNRKIIFTELGYKSTADSAISPWEWLDYMSEEDEAISLETQANCYQAFFDTVWKKDWFVGLYLWQMRIDFEKGRGKNDLDFTPQGKPAMEIIAKRYSRN